MKILVCTDGSAQSQKAIDKTLEITGGCNVEKVTVIHIYQKRYDFFETTTDRLPITHEDVKHFQNIEAEVEKMLQEMLDDAIKPFKERNIKTDAVLKSGHPSETIARFAAEGDYDLIVIGSRGLGGLKKFFLGSVSNAVLQEADRTVMVVK
ncbi:MAG: universal stress protein [Bacillota bacterium]|nr:universal stress protein [Bacillota bacterium]